MIKNYFGFIFLFLATAGAGQERGIDRSLILHGIELTIGQDYLQAEDQFRKVIKFAPDNPAGYLYTAAVIQAWMMDFETTEREKDFYDLCEQTIALSEKMIQADPGNAELYFYMGSAYGYMGIHQSRKKSWFSAFTNGIKGVKALQKCIRLDSTYYDAYMAVGTYKYWRSRMTQFLFWLPFVSDERTEGIRLIKTSAEKGTVSIYVAVTNLAWIDLDAGKYQEAIDWAKKGADRFPASRFFMWVWGYAAQRVGKMEEAKTIFEKILFSVQKESFNNHYNEIECHFKLAEINNSLHRPEEACQHLTEIKKLDLDINIRRRLQNRLIKTELLLKNCPN